MSAECTNEDAVSGLTGPGPKLFRVKEGDTRDCYSGVAVDDEADAVDTGAVFSVQTQRLFVTW